ncbi:acyl carrier protein [Variovorax ureilyticus]|uniref:acyl carrier protein n=1 Tax=Variovorax ureilyticus TaxID=1836198 RepID=UPI003D670E47
MWASQLGIDVNDIRASDNFLDLGGDSLLAMRVIQQAEQALGFRVEPRRYVFETLGQLAIAPRHAGPGGGCFERTRASSRPVGPGLLRLGPQGLRKN